LGVTRLHVRPARDPATVQAALLLDAIELDCVEQAPIWSPAEAPGVRMQRALVRRGQLRRPFRRTGWDRP